MPPISRAPRGPPASTTRSASKVPRALSTTYRPPCSSTPLTSHISNRSTASSKSTAQVALRAATGGWTYPSSAVYVGTALLADHAGRAARRPAPGPAPLQHRDPSETTARQPVRRPQPQIASTHYHHVVDRHRRLLPMIRYSFSPSLWPATGDPTATRIPKPTRL